MDACQLLYTLVDVGGSDLHCKPGSPPHLRIGGVLKSTGDSPLDAAAVTELATTLLSPARMEELKTTGSTIGAHSAPGVGRFRVAGFRQRGSLALIVHAVPHELRAFDELDLPAAAATLASSPTGLVLYASPSGGGVTTTLAAAVHHRNVSEPAHILTVEHPIEVLHRDQRALVSQLEVGVDTPSLAAGVRNAGRLDADVVVVGSIADAATAQACLDIAASGRLVIGAVQAPDVRSTIHSFWEFFSIEERDVARQSLARVLAGVVAQQLLPTPDGAGRVPVAEVAVVTPKIRACLAEPTRLDVELPALLMDGVYHGMQTFDLALIDRVRTHRVTADVAMAYAVDPEELRIELASFDR